MMSSANHSVSKDLDLDRKPRKSVAFSEDTTIVDSNGDVTESNGIQDKTTAESHSSMLNPKLPYEA